MMLFPAGDSDTIGIMKAIKFFALAALLALVGTFAADAAPIGGNPCVLFDQLGYVFRTLRTLAFLGAAFILAGWAWSVITKGWGGDKGENIDGAKAKGIGMLIGFSLLFGLGLIMQFLPGTMGCSFGTWA
jgi:hypothetical protein